jgi:hypothetical protein
MVYAGEKLSIGGSINISSGLIVTNDFGSPLKGGSITYREFPGQLYEFGFTDNKDYVRPLLWSEQVR